MPKHLSQNEFEAGKLDPSKVSRPRLAGPQDVPSLLAHYLRLSEIDRYTRFFSAMSLSLLTSLHVHQRCTKKGLLKI